MALVVVGDGGSNARRSDNFDVIPGNSDAQRCRSPREWPKQSSSTTRSARGSGCSMRLASTAFGSEQIDFGHLPVRRAAGTDILIRGLDNGTEYTIGVVAFRYGDRSMAAGTLATPNESGEVVSRTESSSTVTPEPGPPIAEVDYPIDAERRQLSGIRSRSNGMAAGSGCWERHRVPGQMVRYRPARTADTPTDPRQTPHKPINASGSRSPPPPRRKLEYTVTGLDTGVTYVFQVRSMAGETAGDHG